MGIEKSREQELELKNPHNSRGKHFEIWKQYLIKLKTEPMSEEAMMEFLHKQGAITDMLKTYCATNLHSIQRAKSQTRFTTSTITEAVEALKRG